MNHTALSALPLVAAFALAGCTPTAEPPPPATIVPASSRDGTTADAEETTAWAQQIRDQFLESYDRTDVSQFSDGTPHQKITAWYETGPGHLLVELKGDDWSGARLRWLAIEIIDRAEPDGTRLGKVTVTSEHHGASRTVTPKYVRG